MIKSREVVQLLVFLILNCHSRQGVMVLGVDLYEQSDQQQAPAVVSLKQELSSKAASVDSQRERRQPEDLPFARGLPMYTSMVSSNQQESVRNNRDHMGELMNELLEKLNQRRMQRNQVYMPWMQPTNMVPLSRTYPQLRMARQGLENRAEKSDDSIVVLLMQPQHLKHLPTYGTDMASDARDTKRVENSRWNNLRGMWGKRSARDAITSES